MNRVSSAKIIFYGSILYFKNASTVQVLKFFGMGEVSHCHPNHTRLGQREDSLSVLNFLGLLASSRLSRWHFYRLLLKRLISSVYTFLVGAFLLTVMVVQHISFAEKSVSACDV